MEGLDLALASMRVGELAQVTVPPGQGYGSSPKLAQLAEVPSCSALAFTVELLQVEEASTPSVSTRLSPYLRRKLLRQQTGLCTCAWSRSLFKERLN